MERPSEIFPGAVFIELGTLLGTFAKLTTLRGLLRAVGQSVIALAASGIAPSTWCQLNRRSDEKLSLIIGR